MLYLYKNSVYIKANNKYFKVEYTNNDIKPTKDELYSIDTSKPISYEEAIKILNKKNDTFNSEINRKYGKRKIDL